jgi:hypothetical protein
MEETSSPRPPVPGFQAASTLPRPTHIPSASSHRNATNTLPPVPQTPTVQPEVSKEDTSVAGPSKPVQRPTARKNAIVYNAVQVSPRYSCDLSWRPQTDCLATESSPTGRQECRHGDWGYICRFPGRNTQWCPLSQVSIATTNIKAYS